ncbi:hypothetical protein ABZT49_08400 [Methylobacterium sp. EM32]|uniref:hypothetical protein n=1 Tax=Methylobacterium sp. EM32 TaxID=3163481 RepID=UPI0033A21D72
MLNTIARQILNRPLTLSSVPHARSVAHGREGSPKGMAAGTLAELRIRRQSMNPTPTLRTLIVKVSR